jgi:Fur family peroxide stress response transcriptional regulator
MEHLVKKLRSQGIAVTPQRLTVLAVLENHGDHPSAGKIYQEVRRQLPAISFNTVYKTLEVLHQKGLVLKVNPLHEVARYDGNTSYHAHLICRACQRIMDLDWDPARTFPGGNLQGFRVEHQFLTLWGLCHRCQGAETRKED